jgi:hypothetical protein
VGNRIAAALTFLNAIGLLGCLILLAAASGQVPDLAIQIIRAMKYSLQMFVFGAVRPVIIWSIAASEINRSNVKVKLIEDWARYFLLFASGVLFFVAASRLPNSIISSFGRDGELSSMRDKIWVCPILGPLWASRNAGARDVGKGAIIRASRFRSSRLIAGKSGARVGFRPVVQISLHD